MHPQLRKSYVPLSCPSLVVFWPLYINWYSGVVMHPCSSLPLLLWSVKPFHSGWIGETNSRTSSISRIGSKQLYSADQVAIQLLVCSTLRYYHLYIRNIMGIAHPLMNSCCSDTSCHHYLFLGFRVVATGMPTGELWCVKSVLRGTRCFVVNGWYSYS